MKIAFGIGGAVAFSAVALISSGVASAAPDVVGQKYGDAVGTLSDAGIRPVVSTTVGERLPRPQCVVVNQVSRTVPPPPNSGGGPTNQVLLSLNCGADVAHPGVAGFSAGSPEGSKASKASAAAIASAQAEASAAQAAAEQQQLAAEGGNGG